MGYLQIQADVVGFALDVEQDYDAEDGEEEGEDQEDDDADGHDILGCEEVDDDDKEIGDFKGFGQQELLDPG